MLNILVTLNSGQGANLGPNFVLTADFGSVSPSTATLSELLSGKNVTIDNLATQIIITSTGDCTNSLTLNVLGAPIKQGVEFMYGGIDAASACDNVTIGAPSVYFYAPLGYDPFTIGSVWYVDSLLTTPYPDGFYAMHNPNPNPNDGHWVEISGGQVVNTGICSV